MRNPHPLILCLLIVLLASPVFAQEGHGVVTFLDENTEPVSGLEIIGSGIGGNLAHFISFVYPLLLTNDPLWDSRGTSAYGDGLVDNPPALPDNPQTYTLRDDLTWTDGTPITAYDVVYSLLGREPLVGDPTFPLTGIQLDNEQHFTLAFSETDCTTGSRINSIIVPVHVFNADFREFADDFMDESDGVPSLKEWQDAYDIWSRSKPWFSPSTEDSLSVTGGRFVPAINVQTPYVEQDDLVLLWGGISDRPSVEQFLHGDANLLLDAPYERRADLRSTPGIQLYEAPSYAVDYIVFNQSDPNYPRDAFVDGEPLEQLPHRYFSDVRVRRAVQLAIDVPALIEAALYGNATQINGAYSPASWAYDPDLPMPEYDPDAAKRLLDEAGWRDINGDGYRECFGCLNASPDTPLSIYLGVQSDGIRNRVGEMLRIQLARVGVDLWVGGGDSAYQDFDMFLTGTTARDPDLYRLFAREWDRLGVSDGNVGSVDNPELEAILDSARKVPGCDMEERAALYAEAQERLREDMPAIWLYARHDLYAARGISGFAPLPGEPFWNVSEWMAAR